MKYGDIVASERSPQPNCAISSGTLADHGVVRCGAMMQQDCGPGVQSWPQQFVRLVGGYRRPMPARAALVRNEALTG